MGETIKCGRPVWSEVGQRRAANAVDDMTAWCQEAALNSGVELVQAGISPPDSTMFLAHVVVQHKGGFATANCRVDFQDAELFGQGVQSRTTTQDNEIALAALTKRWRQMMAEVWLSMEGKLS